MHLHCEARSVRSDLILHAFVENGAATFGNEVTAVDAKVFWLHYAPGGVH